MTDVHDRIARAIAAATPADDPEPRRIHGAWSSAMATADQLQSDTW
jgi:hypothetical protein